MVREERMRRIKELTLEEAIKNVRAKTDMEKIFTHEVMENICDMVTNHVDDIVNTKYSISYNGGYVTLSCYINKYDYYIYNVDLKTLIIKDYPLSMIIKSVDYQIKNNLGYFYEANRYEMAIKDALEYYYTYFEYDEEDGIFHVDEKGDLKYNNDVVFNCNDIVSLTTEEDDEAGCYMIVKTEKYRYILDITNDCDYEEREIV